MNTPAPRKPQIVDMDTGEIVAAPDVSMLVSSEIDRQIATAKAYPRSIERFRSYVLTLCTLNEEVAAQCIFAMPRGGKVIEGPSIRFAEIAIAAWGNCRVGAQVVGEEGSFVKALGVFWDLQSNAAMGFEVRRPIVYSKTHKIERLRGQRFDDDMVAVTGNAASSIALRNAALRGVPKALWWDLYLQAKAAAVGDVKTLATRRAAAIDAFKKFGVTEAQIFATLGIAGINEIDLDGLAKLRGFLTAITSEEKDPEEIFAPADTKAARPERQPAPPPHQAGPKNETASPSGGESAGADVQQADGATGGAPDAPPADTAAADDERPPTDLETGIANALIDCKTPADVDAVGQMFRDDILAASKAEQDAIMGQFNNTREAMANRGDLFDGDGQT